MLASFCLALGLGTLGMATWNVMAWPAVTRARRPASRAVSVLVPARDEADTIRECLESVSMQGATIGEVLVYDDRSADGTAALVRHYASMDPRVRVIIGSDLPAGWCGKPHACMRLAQAATCDWLLFLDADARLLPHGVERLLHDAQARNLTLLSAWPGLHLVSWWERLLMPALNLVVFTLYPAPLAQVRDDPSLGLAHGACILARRETYRRVGGHASVRDQLFEDSRLAQGWRARGERSLCLDGQTVVRVRMYRDLGEIWRGFGKNCYPAFRHDASFWAFLGLHTLTYLVPPVLLLTIPSRAAAGAVSAGVLTRLLLAARFRHPYWSAFLHPVATAALVALGLTSRRRYLAASGVEWKGRRYGPRGEVA